jgi:integrase
LAAALKQGQRWGLITRCVTDLAQPSAAGVKPPPDIDPAVWEAVVLDLKEREPVTAMAVLVAGVTGARRGELCGLRWTDVDAECRLLTIARAIQHGLDKTTVVVAPTKTGRERRVALDARILPLFADYRRQAEQWAAQARVQLADDGYILALDPTGCTPLKPDTITAGFAGAARRVGAPIRFHDLRHMSASLLIGAGTDVRTVAGRLGHADASTTLRIYAHAFEARHRQAAELLGAILPGEPVSDQAQSR